MDPSIAVAPDLFDAIAHPEVLLPLVMANAMSPRLWRLGRKVAGAPDPMEAARRAVDTSFTHAVPVLMAEASGYLDLAAERARLGAVMVDRAIADIDRGWDLRRQRGQIAVDDTLQEVIASGRFPAYSYACIDVIHSTRRAPGGPGQRPRGLTSCVDEAALFAALLMTAPQVTARLDGIALIASSLHATVFAWAGDEAWWFWSKRDVFTRDTFAALVAAQGGDAPDTLLGLMTAPIRRITSRRGALDLDTGECSLPADETARTLAAMERFFGTLPPGLADDIAALPVGPPSAHDELFDRAVRAASADEVQAVVRDGLAAGGPMGAAATQALLAYRSLELADITPYLDAARRGIRVTALATGVHSPDDALAAVAAIERGAALGDDARLALPDEVLARGSGSAAERALLLHVLLEHACDVPVSTVLTRDDAITRAGDLAVRASDGARVDPDLVGATGAPLRHAMPPHQQ